MSALLIELESLQSGSFRSRGIIKPAELDFDPNTNFKFSGPITLDVRVSTTDQLAYYVSGQVSYKASGECRRCLKEIEQGRVFEVRGVFAFPESLQKISAPREAEDIFPLEIGATAINLTALIRECMVLDYPVYKLCSEDCKGLCPNCGADLNIESCQCKQESIDSRWAKLSELNKNR